MLVKTDAVKQNNRSIGMFSRNGKMTSLIHSIFREKKDMTSSKNHIEDDLFEGFGDQEAAQPKENARQEMNRTSGSFYFRSVSREKSQPPRVKTPEVGRYRPRFEMIHPKTVTYSSNKEKMNRTFTTEKDPPLCVKDGTLCEFKIRQLRRKIEDLRKVINNTDVDVEALYRNHLISRNIYKLFKTPSLKMFHQTPSKGPNEPTMVTTQDNLELGFQNSHEIVNKIVAYSNLKEELAGLVNKNKENFVKTESKINDRPRSSTPTPLAFGLQTPRPPIVKRQFESFHNDFSLSDMGTTMNKTFMNDRLRHTSNFGRSTKRKPIFSVKESALTYYEFDKFKVSKTDRNKVTAINFGKVVPRPKLRIKNTSIAEFSDLTKSFYSTTKKLNSSYDMKRTTERRLSFPKESTAKRIIQERSPPSFYIGSKSPMNSTTTRFRGSNSFLLH